MARPAKRWRSAGADSPAAALWRIVGSLTPEQERRLAREIKLVTAAVTSERGGVSSEVSVAEGVRARHSRSCTSRSGGACDCIPAWEGAVYARAQRVKVRKTFPHRWEAKAWRHEMLELAEIGQLRPPSRHTLAEVASVWLDLAQKGKITNRSGRRYKPSALRAIEQDTRLHLVPVLGATAMAEVTRADLQRLISVWLDRGLSASKARGIVNTARVLWRDLDLVAGIDSRPLVDPTRGLRLPAGSGRRERIASADEAHRLIEALEPRDQALWATAMYAGLRCGELRALQAHDVDLEQRRINVQRGWDQYEGEIEPKSEKGTRSTIIATPLYKLLAVHLRDTERRDANLVFGRTATLPFNINTVNSRACRAWTVAREREDEEDVIAQSERIRPIGLHECRHTAVSQMLDAGIAIERVSKFMGHASISITIDRYDHLLPAGEAKAIALLDAYHRRRQG